MFLKLSNLGSRYGSVTARGYDVFRCRGGWPKGKVFLVEGREESRERLRSMVRLVRRIIVCEPFLLLCGMG